MAKLTQQQLLEIFNALKAEIKPYEKGTIKANLDIEGRYELWSKKDISYLGKTRKEFAFVAINLQSNYVGFHYMPAYTNPEGIKPKLPPVLLKLLKGKACFHITQINAEIINSIKEALQIGYDEYKKNDWV